MRVAVVGGGISGLVSEYVLAKEGVNVTLYEKEDYLGGHAKTVNVDGIDLDLGFMVFNRVTYPNMMEFFENLGVDMELSDMSFAISLDNGHDCEWSNRNGLFGLFAQKKNVINLQFWQMLKKLSSLKMMLQGKYLDMLNNNKLNMDRNETLDQFIKSRGYSKLFVKAYLLFGRPQWLTVKRRSHNYVKKVKEELVRRGGQVIVNCEVELILTSKKGCVVHCKDGSKEMYDCCIVATHALDTLRILGEEATYDERRILGTFQYAYSFITVKPFMLMVSMFVKRIVPKKHNLGETRLPFLVTLNPNHTPKNTLLKWSTGHPILLVTAFKASQELEKIQGKRGIWFCGAYQGCGYHEDGLKAAGMIAAYKILGRCCSLQTNPKLMVPSWKELSARLFVTRFLSSYITTGSLTLLEEGGTMFSFEGINKMCSLKCVMRIHSPQFYWKVMTQADLGLANAYINGDFSLVDKNEGLLNLFLVFIANRHSNDSSSKLKKNRKGLVDTIFLYSGFSIANFFIKHYFRKNTITQSRRNISNHYDLSNELFALFMDETMTYTCAVFKNEKEDLKDAQLRKMSLLIEKARIDQTHEILDIGCGWGNLVVEIVKKTGCKCTGITLSKEQLKFAEKRVRDAGLQDHIKILLCHYRQLPKTFKYDRIISVGMIEAVGHEYMEEFFSCCESLLADDGLLILE
ncbi:hypothetical protein S83_067006, partial [Arachis hypogaea]